MTKAALRKAALSSTLVFFETQCAIHTLSGDVVGAPIKESRPLRAHVYQQKFGIIEEYCEENGLPCRVIGLKPRRGGSSTIALASIYRRLAKKRLRATTIGDSDDTAKKIYPILKLMAENYKLDDQIANVSAEKADWPNGSHWDQVSAGSKNPGIAGGNEWLHATEVAKWCKSKDATKSDETAWNEISKTVAYLPGTTIFVESTAWGARGIFHDMYTKGSVTFEEFKQGKHGYYIRIFSPWFEFPDYIMTDPTKFGIHGKYNYDRNEQELVERFQITDYQLAWRRWCIAANCSNSEDNFDQDYPKDDTTAFLTSGKRCFNIKALGRMKEDAKAHMWEFGNIAEQPGQSNTGSNRPTYVWQGAAPSDARVMRLEPPKADRHYLISVDLMTGIDQVKGQDPDCHSVTVLRKGWWDATAQDGTARWRPHREVCSLIHDWDHFEKKGRKHTALRWNIGVLEPEVWALAQYYGNCIIIIEMEKDSGLTELLKKRPGVNLYQREIFNKVEEQKKKAYGWSTNAQTRPMIIQTLAHGISEYRNSEAGIEIYDPVALSQLETFIVNSDGKPEAMAGCHDDSVMGLGIGFQNIESATLFRRQIFVRAPLMAERYGPENNQSKEWGA